MPTLEEAGGDTSTSPAGGGEGGVYQTTARGPLRHGDVGWTLPANDSTRTVTVTESRGVYTSILHYSDVIKDAARERRRRRSVAGNDSGTASTTLCSSPSSSPSPSVLTPGGPSTTTMLPPGGPPPGPCGAVSGPGPGARPSTYRDQPPNLPAPRPYRLPDPHIAENSYAEIPYGALPANNFDTPPSGDRGKLEHGWKQLNNGGHSHPNLVNLNLALDYPQQRANAHVHSPAVANNNINGFRTLDVISCSGAEQRAGAHASMVHFRDGPDGLLPVPQPRMATMDLPVADFKHEAVGKRKSRHALLMVVVMALAGVAYLGLGGLAGYYFGIADCDRKCDVAEVAEGIVGNTTVTYPYMTSTPHANTSGNVTSPEVGRSTTLIIRGVTSAATTMSTALTAEPAPQYCSQVDEECRCGPLGGAGGEPFSDRDAYRRLGNITGFAVKHNDYFISGLQVQYGLGHGAEHGYTEGGYRVNVQMLRGEHITALHADFVAGRGYLTRLVVTTDRRVLGPYGGAGGRRYPVGGRKLLYVIGRSGPLIDSLGFVFDQCT